MIEWIPLLIIGGALFPNTLPMNEKKRIMQVFENTDFCIKREGEKEYPTFLYKEENEVAKIFRFRLPLGLLLDDKPNLNEILSKSLNRNVVVDGNSVIKVSIYKVPLPTKWKYEDVPSGEGWNVPIGKTYDGVLWHNFDELQHMTVAGRTRWGKTQFLKVLMTYLIEHHPDDIQIYILDLKAGLAFNKFKRLKQVKCVASNFDECETAFQEIRDHIKQQEEYFKAHDYEDIVDTQIKERVFILIDEAGELSTEKWMNTEQTKQTNYFASTISHIARVSASLGFRMIFSTQYPTADILPRQMKANTGARIAFRLETGTHSEVAINETSAKDIKVKGRFIYKTAERHEAQAPLIKKPDMWNRLRRWEIDSTSEEVRETREDTIIFR